MEIQERTECRGRIQGLFTQYRAFIKRRNLYTQFDIPSLMTKTYGYGQKKDV